MKKNILLVLAFISFLLFSNEMVFADDIVPEFETQATILNTNGAKAYQIIANEVTSSETDINGDSVSNIVEDNLPYVSVVTTIPYNAVVYGDSVSSAPIAMSALIDENGSGEIQRLSLYVVKYNNEKYLVSTGDVSMFKLNDTVIEEDTSTNNNSSSNNQVNEETNPKTGMMGVVATWVIAGLSITFSFYYFLRYTRIN